jgi:hypothetical protein
LFHAHNMEKIMELFGEIRYVSLTLVASCEKKLLITHRIHSPANTGTVFLYNRSTTVA